MHFQNNENGPLVRCRAIDDLIGQETGSRESEGQYLAETRQSVIIRCSDSKRRMNNNHPLP